VIAVTGLRGGGKSHDRALLPAFCGIPFRRRWERRSKNRRTAARINLRAPRARAVLPAPRARNARLRSSRPFGGSRFVATGGGGRQRALSTWKTAPRAARTGRLAPGPRAPKTTGACDQRHRGRRRWRNNPDAMAELRAMLASARPDTHKPTSSSTPPVKRRSGGQIQIAGELSARYEEGKGLPRIPSVRNPVESQTDRARGPRLHGGRSRGRRCRRLA